MLATQVASSSTALTFKMASISSFISSKNRKLYIKHAYAIINNNKQKFIFLQKKQKFILKKLTKKFIMSNI